MILIRLITTSLLIFLLSVIAFSTVPWDEYPEWKSKDLDFTMSVALSDIDGDDDLDLIAGNYRYPYLFNIGGQNAAYLGSSADNYGIGEYLVAYQYGASGFPTATNGVHLTSVRRCIDCIAVADYDSDGDYDIAMGLVVGLGNDGGVMVLDNISPPMHTSLADFFSDVNSNYYWESEDSYDCHCVRWADVDNDGDIDLAALELPGILHLYLNDGSDLVQQRGVDFFEPLLTTAKGMENDSGTDDLSASVSFDISGTTMEFGDMDGDGYLDLFVNSHVFNNELSHCKNLRVYENLGGYYDPDTYWISRAEQGTGREYGDDFFCGSFGQFEYENDPYIALAIGSRSIHGASSEDTRPAYNDIYIYDSGIDDLRHVGRSDVSTVTAQSVTDIQWAYLEGSTDTDRDIVAVSYPLYAGNGEWERGFEQLHIDPAPTPANSQFGVDNFNEVTSGYHDKSTSLAIGDIDQDAAEEETIIISEANFESLIYVDKCPFIQLLVVDFQQSDVSQGIWEWDDISSRDFEVAFDPVNGWISIDTDHGVSSFDEVEITILYSPEFDLAVGNDGKNVVYYWDEDTGTSGDDPSATLTEFPPETGYTPHYYDTTQLPGTTADLMSSECIGFTAEPYGPFDIEPYLDNSPDINRVGFLHHWREVEIFQGHYFWDWLDQNLDKVQELDDGTSHLVLWGDPTWTFGDYDPEETDPCQRASHMPLNMMMVHNLVNRYRPSGLIATATNGFSWGSWGVELYQFENEPNYCTWGYGNHRYAREDIAEKTYLQFQVIKEISENAGYTNTDLLKLISPNFGPERWAGEGDDVFICPPMPYLHALNDVDLTATYPGAENILWKHCDYISTQIYGGKRPDDDEFCRYIDNFTPEFTPDDLPLGFEHMLWGYYSEGLYNYLDDFMTLTRSEWNPVMIGGTGEEYDYEKPFFIFDVIMVDFMDTPISYPDEDLPEDDWFASRIAEMFSIDVYPGTTARTKRLVECFPNRWMGHQDAFRTSAKFLNNSGITFDDYDMFVSVDDEDTVHCYTYKYTIGSIEDDKYVHFVRSHQEDTPYAIDYMFAQDGYDFDNLETGYASGSVVDCYTPEGNMFQKDVDVTGSPKVVFEDGEMGPAMLIIHENSTAAHTDYDQSIHLYGIDTWSGHEGWNLISWQLDLTDLYGQDILMAEILEDVTANDWFFNLATGDTANGAVMKYDDNIHNYPNYEPQIPWKWDLDQAYYVHLDSAHTWTINGCPKITPSSMSFTTSDAWARTANSYYYFMCYTADGYTKIASSPYNQTSGDPLDYDYTGPFHDLIWEDANTAYDLVAVYTDDGRSYIPSALSQDPIVDQIEILEPGCGYKLGFYTTTATQYTFDGWSGYPNWTVTSMPKDPSTPNPIIASATNHFQYKRNSQWFYPIVVDTVDLEECPMEVGDEIGVFDDELCVGAMTYSGQFPVVISAWEDDIATPEIIDGYEYGNTMTFIWFDASENTENEFELPPITSAVDDDPVAPTHSGFGVGFYAKRSFTSGIALVDQLPTDFRMCQNYPNPFNAETIIPLELPERSEIKIELYNVQGQKVASIFEGIQNAGLPKIKYDASAISTGVYFIRIEAKGLEKGKQYKDIGKMLLVK